MSQCIGPICERRLGSSSIHVKIAHIQKGIDSEHFIGILHCAASPGTDNQRNAEFELNLLVGLCVPTCILFELLSVASKTDDGLNSNSAKSKPETGHLRP